MTTISITFVICLGENEKKLSLKNKRKKSLPIEEEESKLSVNLKSVEDTVFESTTKYVVYVDRPVKSLQIEYEIIPKYLYTIDVIFWGPIVKIITKDSIKSISSITKLRNTWITFTVEHKVMLDITELMLLKSYTIPFLMRVERNGMIANITVPETSTFFFLNEDVDFSCIFAEAFEYIPNNDFEDTSRVEEDVKIILREILHFAYRGEILNILKVPDIKYRKKILNMMNSFTANVEYECFNTYVSEGANVNDVLNEKPPTPVQQKIKVEKKEAPKKKIEKKKRKSSVQENNFFQLNVYGQVLFTDPKMTVFNFGRRTNDMKCGFLIINVTNLITPIQKSILNPVVIRLKKLINVPVETLTKERFNYVYLTYNICDFPCTTIAKPISNTIHFKSHRIFFLEKKNKIFAQQAQKDFLVVQMHGLRNRLVTNVPELFGTNPEDKNISVPMRNRKDVEKYLKTTSNSYNESVLLSVVCFKLNLLLSTFRTFTEAEFCIHPSRCPIPLTKNPEQLANTFTINSINIDSVIAKPVYPLSEDVILDSLMSLVVQMELHKPVNKLLTGIVQKEIFYNRILLVTGHVELAKYILSSVFMHNSCWIYKDDIVPPNYLPNYESTSDINNINIITGFSIDNGDIYIMFLEGNAKWIKNVLWQHIRNEFFTCAKIHYNSDYVYKERVYTSLIPYGGVYNVTLHTPLRTVLDCSKIFSPGYLPEPCRRAYEKIDMILKSKSTNEITVNMLPTKKELLSLDIEWGVPIHWPLTKQHQHSN